MKLYRFMSAEECYKLVLGKVLENHTDHSVKRGTASTAKGFCFGIGDEEQAKKALRRLRGIVSTDILMVFEPKDISNTLMSIALAVILAMTLILMSWRKIYYQLL